MILQACSELGLDIVDWVAVDAFPSQQADHGGGESRLCRRSESVCQNSAEGRIHEAGPASQTLSHRARVSRGQVTVGATLHGKPGVQARKLARGPPTLAKKKTILLLYWQEVMAP